LDGDPFFESAMATQLQQSGAGVQGVNHGDLGVEGRKQATANGIKAWTGGALAVQEIAYIFVQSENHPQFAIGFVLNPKGGKKLIKEAGHAQRRA
jgi:hypothetical protein